MAATEQSAMEKLEQMLREGKITEEDFHQLSAAAERTPHEEPREEKKPREKPMGFGFKRDTENGVIGGICAGAAKRWGMEVGLMRAIVLILTILLMLLSGAGFLVALSYLVLWIFVPRESKEEAAHTA